MSTSVESELGTDDLGLRAEKADTSRELLKVKNNEAGPTSRCLLHTQQLNISRINIQMLREDRSKRRGVFREELERCHALHSNGYGMIDSVLFERRHLNGHISAECRHMYHRCRTLMWPTTKEECYRPIRLE